MTQNEIMQMLKVESPKTISREYLYVYVPKNYVDVVNEQQDIYKSTLYVLDLATAYAIGKYLRATVAEGYTGATITDFSLFIQSVAPIFEGIQSYYYFYNFDGVWYVNTTGEPSYNDQDIPTDPAVGGDISLIGISVEQDTVVFAINVIERDIAQDDLGYHNNSKYYSEQANQSAQDAESAKTDAESAKDLADGYASAAQQSATDAQGYANSAAEVKTWIQQNVVVSGENLANTIAKRDASGKLFATTPDNNAAATTVATVGYISSAIATQTYTFCGTYETVSALAGQVYAEGKLKVGDYAFVISDGTLTVGGQTAPKGDYVRYKCTAVNAVVPTTTPATYTGTWVAEFILNNSAFTLAQWDAINSGITASKVSDYDGYAESKEDAFSTGRNLQKTVVSNSHVLQVYVPSLSLASSSDELTTDILDNTGYYAFYLTGAILGASNSGKGFLMVREVTQGTTATYRCYNVENGDLYEYKFIYTPTPKSFVYSRTLISNDIPTISIADTDVNSGTHVITLTSEQYNTIIDTPWFALTGTGGATITGYGNSDIVLLNLQHVDNTAAPAKRVYVTELSTGFQGQPYHTELSINLGQQGTYTATYTEIDYSDYVEPNATVPAGTTTSALSTVRFGNSYYSLFTASDQVQANWSETNSSSKAYIQNKPTVNSNTLTINVNDTTKGIFQANAGDVTVNITAEDLGLSSATRFIGVVTYKGITSSAISVGDTTNPVVINNDSTTITSGEVVKYNNAYFIWSSGAWAAFGENSTVSQVDINGTLVTVNNGDVILLESAEYLWDSAKWVLLGDSSSYALKSIVVSGTDGLTGSGTLESNVTLRHATGTSGGANKSLALYPIATDAYGHVSDTGTAITSATATEGGTDVSLVTTGEKYTWNHKSDFSGSYNDLTDKPTIPVMPTIPVTDVRKGGTSLLNGTVAEIPANLSSYNNDSGFVTANTWRPVKVNGTQKLDSLSSGNALDLVAGTNITLSESGGAVTISATGGGDVAGVNINGTSIVDGTTKVANIVTETAYDATDNKIATMADIPEGDCNITISGTGSGTEQTLSSIAVGNTTYNVPAGSTATDVTVNGTSIVDNGVANIVTETAYDASTNKIATMSDINSAITGAYKVKGGASYSTLNGLTKQESMNGDVYNITTGGSLNNGSSATIGSTTVVSAGDNVVFIWGTSDTWYWDKLAATVDLSAYLMSTDAASTYTAKSTAYSSSSAGIALGGTSASPTITVTEGSVSSGNASVVTGGTVYTALGNKQNTLTTSSVNDGTLATVIGFDSSNNLVKGSAPSGANQTIKVGSTTFDANDAINFAAGTGLSVEATTTSGSEAVTYSVDTSTVAMKTDIPAGQVAVEFNPSTVQSTIEALNGITVGTKTYTVSGGASVTDLTANNWFSFALYSSFSGLVTSHYTYVDDNTNVVITGDFVRVKCSMVVTDGGSATTYTFMLHKNGTNSYVGMFYVPIKSGNTLTNLYEIGVYFDGEDIYLRSATIK